LVDFQKLTILRPLLHLIQCPSSTEYNLNPLIKSLQMFDLQILSKKKIHSSLTNKYIKMRATIGLVLLGFCFFGNFQQVFAAKYYVGPTGDNSVSSAAAKSSATPWQTLTFAIGNAAVLTNDSIVVLPGIYSETNIGVTKGLKIFGNETGGIPGVGAKPVFNGASSVASGSIFLIQSGNVLIKNLELQVNQNTTIRGIFSAAGGFNLLRIEDNNIFSTGVGTIFTSFGIQLGQSSSLAGLDSFLIIRNNIGKLNSTTAAFGRAIRLIGGYGRIGGDLSSEGNTLEGTYGVQCGDARRAIQVLNNQITGSSAALEINIPAANSIHRIERNTFRPLIGVNSLSMIEIKNNINTNSIIRIANNQFLEFPGFGVFSTRSQNVQVLNNVFNPSDTATRYIHICVNTKQQTTATDAARSSSITATGNDFQSNGLGFGYGIVFQNHNSSTTVEPFTNIQIGGAGSLANAFGENLMAFVALDTSSGNSTNLSIWNQTNYKVTRMLPAKVDLDLSLNSFNVGSGAKLPSALTAEELFSLEDKLIHGIDFDSLGFLTVIPNRAYVTENSFISPKTNEPSLQRGVTAAKDGWTIIAQPFSYPETVIVDKSVTLQSEPSANISVQGLSMNGNGKTLSIATPVSIFNTLNLSQGFISLAASDLRLNAGGVVSGGNAQSYIQTTGVGKLVYRSLTSAKIFPLGTSTAYFPATLTNTGTSDDFGLGIQNDVLSGGLTGTPVDSVVGVTWVLNEAVSGGSNLSLSAQWPASSEKPFFTRSATSLQAFGTRWNTVSGPTAIASTGTDPHQATFSGLTGPFTNVPVRIKTFEVSTNPSKLYYVDNATGVDTRSNDEAKNPNTPWKTIANALALTSSGDSIQVFSGTYTEFDLRVTKSLTILGSVVGVGVGPGAGTGVKPIINGAGPSLVDSSIFIVTATNVNIRNFNIKVDQLNIKLGINAPKTGFGGLVIEDNLIESTRDIVGNFDVIVMSHAILLARLSTSGNDSIIVRRNVIDREGPTKMWFSRGVRWWGGRGMIGGNTLADGNEVHADFAIQIGDGNGRIQTRNNSVFGRAAGIEYNTLAPTFRHTIANNTVRPLDEKGHFALIEIKSNIRTTGPTAPAPPFIDIENNTLIDFYNIGVALTRSRNCNVVNNTFSPKADSTNYKHVWVNSKQRTSGTAASQPPLAIIETLIQGNTFNSNNVLGGMGIAYQNANRNASGRVFTVNTIGGAGTLANTFGPNIAKVAYLDTVSGPSSANSFWSKPGINWAAWPSTPMGPIKDNFDFSANLFDVGTGSKRPDVMTNAELLLLEDRVVHKIDADSLGFITMKPNHVFVTLNSFIAPLTTEPRIQRALNSTTADGFTVNIETGNYNGGSLVSRNTTFEATPDGEVTLAGLEMNGNGKTLLMNDPIKISSSLNLVDGVIDIQNSDLTIEPAATVVGGSLLAHVRTIGNGYFVHSNLSTANKRFPIGTATRYAEVELANTGTADNLGLKLKDDVFSAGLLGTPIDTAVAITYQIRETIQGASNLTFKATWITADEKPNFNRAASFVQQFNGVWGDIGGVNPIAATGTDPFTLTANISGNWNEQAVRISSAKIKSVGNIYYVDDNTGLDTRTNAEAKNPNTPWLTIAKALESVVDGDSIQVFAGTYNEADLVVNKKVSIFGNVIGVGTGVGAGTGVKPLVNGNSATPAGALFIVQATDVLIKNFELQVNQSATIRGIFAPAGGFNRLRIEDNFILSTTATNNVFNSFGIQLGQLTTTAGLDSFLIVRNEIRPLVFPGNGTFGRGIRLLGGFGKIGSTNPIDSNIIVGDYGIQADSMRGNFQVLNNNIQGSSAALEFNAPVGNTNHLFEGNNFGPVTGRSAFSLVEFKNNTAANSNIRLVSNELRGHQLFGLFSTRSRNVLVQDNRFIPSDTSRFYTHIQVNTKQQTSGNDAATNSGISILGNNFGSNTTAFGTAIGFANHFSGANPPFTNVQIGGTGAEANTFAQNIGKFFVLDPLFGLSNSTTLWAGSPVSTMRPVGDPFDITNNLFGVSGGQKLPANFTDLENYELEDKVVHAIDYDSLGFVTWKTSFAYVTDSSFLRTFTTAPSLQRAVNAAGANDTWQVNIQPKEISETVTVRNSIIWNTLPLDSMRLGGISMNGTDKVLTLQDRFILVNNLTLNNANGGKINIGNNDLVTLATANVTIGSLNSYVISNGTGGLVRRGVTDAPTDFPVGVNDAFGFAPVLFDDANNTGDEFKVTVRPAATNADFTPALPADITTFAKFQWTICDKITGGSNAQIRFDYSDPANVVGSATINGIVQHNGTIWDRKIASIIPPFVVRGLNYTSFCSPFAIVGDPALTSIVTGSITHGGLLPGQLGKYCIGDTLRIPFTVTGTGILGGNFFTAFLSNPDGTFPANGGTSLNIAPLAGTISDVILGIVPVGVVPGLTYKIRVQSSTPVIIGSESLDTIKIYGPPVAPVITGNDTICQGSSTTLTSTAASSYTWTPGLQNVQSITVSSGGPFRVRITDVNGCKNISAPFALTVNPRPVAEAITFNPSLTSCLGDSITLTANPAGLTYNWQTPAITTRDLKVKTAGSFSVIVTNASGCSDTSVVVNTIFNQLPAKPTATTPNGNICQPGPLVFQTSTPSNIYSWAINNITPNPTTDLVNIANPGVYKGVLTITDGNGCRNSSDTVYGTLKKAPVVPSIFAINGNLTVCDGNTVQLRVDPFSPNNNYTWNPDGQTTQIISISNVGSLTVSVKVDSNGCSSQSASVVANIGEKPPKPLAFILPGGSASFCQGSSATLTSTNIGAGSFEWSPGGGSQQDKVVNSTGSYKVVTISANGCRSEESNVIDITVNPIPDKPVISADVTSFCDGGSSLLKVNNFSIANTYSWNYNNSTTETLNVDRTANVIVNATTANGCSSQSDTIKIVRKVKPVAVITPLNGILSVCQGDSIILRSDSVIGNRWLISSQNTTPTITIKNTTLDIKLLVTNPKNGCFDTSGAVSAIVNRLPIVNLLKDTAITSGDDLELVAITSASLLNSYEWIERELKRSTPSSSTRFPITPDRTLTYVVILTDSNGCKATDSVRVRVSSELFIPSVFSPNKDGSNEAFKVYGFGVESIDFKIWDRLGNLIYETSRVEDIVEESPTKDSVKGWDGTYKGKQLGQESYIWSIKGKLFSGEDIKVKGGNKSGSVILLN
jgi:gliding motility-associated-like protein